ncbi:MAG: hypothetical protein LM577_00740 [Thermoproteaceae archaeon]|nr:hypothetical protein [Thermoproteaceae archaeon]
MQELIDREREARELRRREADWNYINSLPPRVRAAIKLFIETGNLRLSQKVSGLGLEEFVEHLRRANVWVT